MKYYDLSAEEKQILEDYDKGLFVTNGNLANTKKKLQEVAKNTLDKTKSINIRISIKTLLGLRAKAIEEGLPYQTLAGSILHKYVTGKFTD